MSLELPDAEPSAPLGVTCSQCTRANPVTATLCVSCDTPLGQVAFAARSPIFVYLPGPKAHLNPPDGTGQRLYDAANAGRVEEVRALCNEWAGNVKVMNFKYGGQYTPLYTASQNDRHEVVDVLLSTAGVDANMADSHDQSPLWRAAYTGNIKCVQHLLAARARGVEVDINYIDNDGWTPLQAAMEVLNLPNCCCFRNKWAKGCAEVVRLLVDAGGVVISSE